MGPESLRRPASRQPRRTGFGAALITIGLLVAAAPAMAAQLVIIDSTGSTLAPGSLVDSQARLTLGPGASVTLVARDGKVFKITGPFEGAPGGLAEGGGDSLSATLSRMLEARRRDTTALGTTRSASGPRKVTQPPSYRLINTAGDGDQCILDADDAALWRADSAPAATLSLQSESGGASLSWPAGEAILAWPGQVAVVDAATYALNLAGRPARFVLHTAPKGLLSAAHRAAWLTAKDCAWQAEILLQAVMAADAAQDNAGPEGEGEDGDRRSQIIETDGYAYLSEDMTLKQMRSSALENAKSIALESSETYMRKLSRVKDFELQYTVAESATEGGVRVLKFEDLGIQPDNRYKVWIRAEVLYFPISQDRMAAALDAEKAGSSPAAPGSADKAELEADAPLTVKVWTEKDRYAENDMMKILIRGNKDFYANVYYRMADGTLVRILPNAYRKQHHFIGGKTYILPGDEDRFDLRVTPPFGTDTISVHASTRPIEDTSGAQISGGIFVKTGTLASIAQATRGKARGIALEARESTVEEFYDARWQVATHK